MQPHQQEYFLDQVAPYYLYGKSKDRPEMMYKDMEYMARAVAQNRDVSSILGIDFRTISSTVHSLPLLQQQSQAIQYKQKTDAEIIDHINKLIDKYVVHVGETVTGKSNNIFSQSAHIDLETMPVQGWKFHISATDLQDYEKLMEKLCPEFDALGIDFKVVRPEVLDHQTNSQQIGKAITIYPSPSFDLNRLSPELRAMLEQESLHPIGDAQIQGRIHARYGKFRGGANKFLIAPDGKMTLDLKHQQTAPEFVKENSADQIFSFYDNCNRRYSETNDAKMYLQEMTTMTQGNVGFNAFVTLCMDDPSEWKLYQSLRMDPNGNSFVYNLNGQQYTLLHAEYADQVMADLDSHGIGYTRPDWDQRYNVYAVHPAHTSQMISVIDSFNELSTNKNSPHMSMIKINDDMIGVEVDTTLTRQFLDICAAHDIAIGTMEINVDINELTSKEQDFGWQHQDVGDSHEGFEFIRE
jgi:hypothetical protein